MAFLPDSSKINYHHLGQMGLSFLLKNRTVIASVAILAVGAYSINRISTLSQPEIDSSSLNKQLAELKQITFDQEAIQRIQQLNSSDVNIESDVIDRNNPFNE